METKFFPTVSIKGKNLQFNSEAVETMELDVEGSKVILMKVTNKEAKRNPNEILIVKTNGSLCDDLENIKDVFPPEKIRPVQVISNNGEIFSGSITIEDEMVKEIHAIFGKDKDAFKLLACNTDSPLGKEFKEQFDIQGCYYRLTDVGDKRNSIGKEKNVKENTEERININ